MRTVTLAVPALGFVIVTRAALAAGIALLVAERLPMHRRRAIGSALVVVGAVTTIPILGAVRRSMKRRRGSSGVELDRHLIGATRFPRKGDDIY